MKHLLTYALVSLFATSAQAATLNWANGGGRGNMFVLADGSTRVAAGSLIEVGFYATSGDATTTFTSFGTTTMGDPGTGLNAIGGHIPGSGKGIASALADGVSTYEGKQFAIRVYNTASAATATQAGIFTASIWTTPGAGGFNDSADSATFTVGFSAAPNSVSAVALLDTRIAANIGTYSVGNVTVAGGTNAAGSIYKLGAMTMIPEPTTSTLSGLMILGLIAKRRRN